MLNPKKTAHHSAKYRAKIAVMLLGCLLPALGLFGCQGKSEPTPEPAPAVKQISWLVPYKTLSGGISSARVIQYIEEQTNCKITFFTDESPTVLFWKRVKSGNTPDLVTTMADSSFALQLASSEEYCGGEELTAVLSGFTPQTQKSPYGVGSLSAKRYAGENIYINQAQFSASGSPAINGPADFTQVIGNVLGNKSEFSATYSRLPVVIDPDSGFDTLAHLFGIEHLIDPFVPGKWQQLVSFLNGIGMSGSFQSVQGADLSESAFAYIGRADRLNVFHEELGRTVFVPCSDFKTGEGFLSAGSADGLYSTFLSKKGAKAGGEVLSFIMRENAALFSYGIDQTHYLKSGAQKLPIKKSLNEFKEDPYGFLKQSGIGGFPFFGYEETPYTGLLFQKTALPLKQRPTTDAVSPTSEEGYGRARAEEQIKETLRRMLYSPHRLDEQTALAQIEQIISNLQ